METGVGQNLIKDIDKQRLLDEYTEEIDEQVLAARGYSLAVVFSSSVDGAKFEGAVGSTLKVCHVRVACAKTE